MSDPFNELVEQVAQVVIARLAPTIKGDELVDQHHSPLPPRAHCALARRLAADKHPGAAIIGRRFMLSRAAIAENLPALHSPWRSEKKPPTAFDIALAQAAALRAP